jgi:hypothetical protein
MFMYWAFYAVAAYGMKISTDTGELIYRYRGGNYESV